MGLAEQGGKPSGVLGIAIGRLMNSLHTRLYRKYFKDNMPASDSVILDVGCGGGKFAKYLSEKNKSYHITGIDHSQEMIKLAKKINSKAIDERRLQFFQKSLAQLDYPENHFD